jgi:DNA-binding PadR family transcriptional regulator
MVVPLDSTIDAAKKGSADLLILALVDDEPLHGYEIAGRIET